MGLRDNKGFGIVESIMAVLIISIAMAGLAELYVSSLYSKRSDLQEYIVKSTSVNQMERLLCLKSQDDASPCSDLNSNCGISCSGPQDGDDTHLSAISPDCLAPCTITWAASCVETDGYKKWTLEVRTTNPVFTSYVPE